MSDHESRGPGWNFFAAVAFVFMPDNRALFRLWELRTVVRDAWLEAGGCERCCGVRPFCIRCLASQKPSAGIDPMLTLNDIEERLQGTLSRSQLEPNRIEENPELAFTPSVEAVGPGERMVIAVRMDVAIRLEHMVNYGSDRLSFQLQIDATDSADSNRVLAAGPRLTGLTFNPAPICRPGSVIRLVVVNHATEGPAEMAHVIFRGHTVGWDNRPVRSYGENIRWRG